MKTEMKTEMKRKKREKKRKKREKKRKEKEKRKKRENSFLGQKNSFTFLDLWSKKDTIGQKSVFNSFLYNKRVTLLSVVSILGLWPKIVN